MQTMAQTSINMGARLTVRSANPMRKMSLARVSRTRTVVTKAALASPIANDKVEIGTYGLSAAADLFVAGSLFLNPAKLNAAINSGTAAGIVNYAFAGVALLAGVAAVRGVVAAQRNRLDSDTYQRLTLSMALNNIAPAALLYVYGSSIQALPTVAAAIVGAKALAGASQIAIWLRKSSRPASLLKDVAGCIGDTLTVPKNLLSALYTVLTLGAGAVALSYGQAALPAKSLVGAAILSKATATSALALAGIFYTLKNGADRNCLGRGTFKQLNEALAVTAAVVAGVLYRSGSTNNSLMALAGITAVTCAYQGITAVISKGPGGTVAEQRGNYKYETEDPLETFCSSNPDAEECKVFED